MFKKVFVVNPVNINAIMGGADVKETVYKCIEEAEMTGEEYAMYEPVAPGILLCARYLPIDRTADVILGAEAISIIAGHAAAKLIVPYAEELKEELKAHLFKAIMEFENAQADDAEPNEEGSFLEWWLGMSKEDAAARVFAAMMESLKI